MFKSALGLVDVYRACAGFDYQRGALFGGRAGVGRQVQDLGGGVHHCDSAPAPCQPDAGLGV
jgi:hypothetical protein